MNNFFYKLDKEKQKRIINASLCVFSKNDFKKGSTDVIAAKAQIAKGSLFQYFKNKKALYLFLYEYSLDVLGKKAKEHFNFDEKDYFQILQQSMMIKLMLLKQDPHLYQFIIKANEEKNLELALLIQEINHNWERAEGKKFFRGLDNNKFKEGTNFELLNKMINWCTEGIWDEGVKAQRPIEEIHQEAIDVINFFRDAVYKEYD